MTRGPWALLMGMEGKPHKTRENSFLEGSLANISCKLLNFRSPQWTCYHYNCVLMKALATNELSV